MGCQAKGTQHSLPSSAHSCSPAPSPVQVWVPPAKLTGETYQAPNIVILIVWFGVSAGVLAQEMNMILV